MKSSVFGCSDQVRRLNEIKIGDKVVVEYLRSIAYELREPTASEKASPVIEAAIMAKAPSDLPPGIAGGRQLHSIVTVIGIDRERQNCNLAWTKGKGNLHSGSCARAS